MFVSPSKNEKPKYLNTLPPDFTLKFLYFLWLSNKFLITAFKVIEIKMLYWPSFLRDIDQLIVPWSFLSERKFAWYNVSQKRRYRIFTNFLVVVADSTLSNCGRKGRASELMGTSKLTGLNKQKINDQHPNLKILTQVLIYYFASRTLF